MVMEMMTLSSPDNNKINNNNNNNNINNINNSNNNNNNNNINNINNNHNNNNININNNNINININNNNNIDNNNDNNDNINNAVMMGQQASTLLDLMTIRAFHSTLLRQLSVGTAIGFRTRAGEMTDIPAIIVFVARKLHKQWLHHLQWLPTVLEVSGFRV
jgi:hypothetical protein